MYNKLLLLLKSKVVAVGLTGLVAGTVVVGSVNVATHQNDNPAQAEVLEVSESKAPVFSLKNEMVLTKDANAVNLTDMVSVKGNETTKLEMGYFQKLSDPTVLNEETEKAFRDKISKKTDDELLNEVKKQEGVIAKADKLEDGIYSAVVTAKNPEGKASSKAMLLVVDATAPAIAHDAADEKLAVPDLTKAPEVALKENQVVDNFDGNMTGDAVQIAVTEKDAAKHIYLVTITAKDKAGNEAKLEYDLTLVQKQATASSGTKKTYSRKSGGSASAGGSSAGGGYVEPTNIYKYCPTSIGGTVLYCSNEWTPGEVKDGIYLNGTRVLTTTPGAWDSVQVCDPSVIAGNFSFNGGGYRYLMAYLGCRTYNCTNNEVGFAVSNDLYNWVKVGRVVGSLGGWGVGQPSLITHNGNIFLFYTQGTASLTNTQCRQLLSGDLTSVQLSGPVAVRNMGGDFISNADFAVSGGQLYMTCDTHVNYAFPPGALNFISATQSVYVGNWDGTLSGLSGIGWSRVAAIGAGTTGHERNHNGCFVRDAYGNLASRAIYVSTADPVGDWNHNLWTYRFQVVGF
jgi:hypothetical protein